jgi:hypothetical protein
MAGEHAAAIDRICSDLNLPRPTHHQQDWEYELSDEYRTTDWIRQYLAACRRADYGRLEKQILMTITLDCINDLVQTDTPSANPLWKEAESLLRTDQLIFHDILDYWAVHGDPLEDAFPITPRIRSLLATMV